MLAWLWVVPVPERAQQVRSALPRLVASESQPVEPQASLGASSRHRLLRPAYAIGSSHRPAPNSLAWRPATGGTARRCLAATLARCHLAGGGPGCGLARSTSWPGSAIEQPRGPIRLPPSPRPGLPDSEAPSSAGISPARPQWTGRRGPPPLRAEGVCRARVGCEAVGLSRPAQ